MYQSNNLIKSLIFTYAHVGKALSLTLTTWLISVFFFLAVGMVHPFSKQFDDAIVVMHERGGPIQLFFFAFNFLWLVWVIQHSAYRLLTLSSLFRFSAQHEMALRLVFLHVGSRLCALPVVYTLWNVIGRLGQQNEIPKSSPTFYVISSTLLLAILIIVVGVRDRPAANEDGKKANLKDGSELPTSDSKPSNRPSGVSWFERTVLIYTIIISIVGAVGWSFWPTQLGEFWGVAPTVFAGLFAICTISFALRWSSQRFKVPIFPVLFALFAISTWLNVGISREVQTRQVAHPPLVGKAFRSWVDRGPRPAAIRRYREEQKEFPVIVVSAQGGGIRATAHVLLTLCILQDRYPNFHHHLFAISGVSGGSVGAVLFSALIEKYGGQNRPARFYESKAMALLQYDFLTPSLGRLFFLDLPGSFVPFNLPGEYWDRSHALAESFRSAWKEAEGDDFLSQDLITTSRNARYMPQLALNATSVSLGTHRALSTINFSRVSRSTGILDLNNGSTSTDLRLCDAAALSARFPIITSVGSIPVASKSGANLNGAPSRRDWLIDGGYYDNSGIETQMALATFITEAANFGFPSLRHRVRLRIVLISVGMPKKLGDYYALKTSPPFVKSFSPVFGVANVMQNPRFTRSTHEMIGKSLKYTYHKGSSIFVALDAGQPKQMEETKSLEFETVFFEPGPEDLLLGWTLSKKTLGVILKSIILPRKGDSEQGITYPLEQVGAILESR